MGQRGLETASLDAPDFAPITFTPVTFEAQQEEPVAQASFNNDPYIVRELTPKELSTRLFPVDEIGMPMTIYVPEEYWDRESQDYNGEGDYEDEDASNEYEWDDEGLGNDDHHHWAPKKKMRRKHGDLGKMLRDSRVQRVPVGLHRRFNKHFDKTPLPKTRIARFGNLLLSAARYVSYSVDVRPEVPVIRKHSQAERQAMWEKNDIRLNNVQKVQELMLKYVAQQELVGVDAEEIREFVGTRDDAAKIEIGKKLFRIAAKKAVEPVGLNYVRAWHSGYLPRQDLGRPVIPEQGILKPRALPSDAYRFIARHVIANERAELKAINQLKADLVKRQKKNRVRS